VAHLEVDRGLDEEELAPLVLDPHPLDELLEGHGGRRAPVLPLLQGRRDHEPLEAGLQGERIPGAE
jgi:hypothetical protein